MSSPITRERRQQGWRVDVPAIPGARFELALCTLTEASVVSVRFEGANVDGGGFIEVATTVQEAIRLRTLEARQQGFALSTPAGVTRVTAVGFSKPFRAIVQVAEGVAITEHVGRILPLGPGTSFVAPAPELARVARVTCLHGAVSVTVPLGVVALAAGQSIELAAYAAVAVTESTGINAAAASIVWEVTS